MKIKEIYPKGGTDRMWEPLHLEITGLDLPGITIQGSTDGRDGAEIRVFYKGEHMSRHGYNYHESLGYHFDMAHDSAEDINLILEMEEVPGSVTAKELAPIMEKVRNKCESRYGNRLPDSDYEILVIFN